MITIKNRQTGDTQKITYEAWQSDSFNDNLFKVIEKKDIVNVFAKKDARWHLHVITDRYYAIKLMTDFPNTYKFLPSRQNTHLSDLDFKYMYLMDMIEGDISNQLLDDDSLLERLTKRPKQIPRQPHRIKVQVGTGESRNSFKVVSIMAKNDYIKFVVIGIIVGLIVAYVVYLLRWNK